MGSFSQSVPGFTWSSSVRFLGTSGILRTLSSISSPFPILVHPATLYLFALSKCPTFSDSVYRSCRPSDPLFNSSRPSSDGFKNFTLNIVPSNPTNKIKLLTYHHKTNYAVQACRRYGVSSGPSGSFMRRIVCSCCPSTFCALSLQVSRAESLR